MKKQWWKESVVYQIYPRSFMDSNGDGIGDIKGIMSKLDYLEYLGVDVIWICPIYESPNDDNGYDISDYQAILAEFGTMEDFDLLLKEVHKRGMRLIMDLVMNHTSDEHAWFIESRSSRDNPKRDWYIWRDGKNGGQPNNWKSIFEGSVWEYDEQTGQYYFHLFSKKQPDLNWENKEVREALKEIVVWWLDKGIDGFRIDAISHIKKEPGLPDLPNPTNEAFVDCMKYVRNVKGIETWLQKFAEDTYKKYDVMTVGEANGVTVEDAANLWVREDGGFMDMIFQFEHLGLWGVDVTGPVDVIELKRTLTKWQKGLEGKGWNALFLENHDQPRSVSVIGDDGKYWQESAKMLAAMYFLMQGTPYIYQGQEIGMTNVQFPSIEDYDDIRIRNFYKAEREKGRSHEEAMEVVWRHARDNTRTPMQWTAGKNAGFTTGDKTWLGINPNYVEINVENQVNDPDSILHFYRKLIALRKQYDLFVYGTYDLLMEEHPQLYVYKRTLADEKAIIICNLTKYRAIFDYEGEETFNRKDLLVSNYYVPEHSGEQSMILNPYECRVYMWKKGKS